MIPEKEREALMRLKMCARIECDQCIYRESSIKECDERIVKNFTILADALRVDESESNPNASQHNQSVERVETPDLHDLMHRFEELCHDMTLQLRSASAEIALAIRETQGKE